MIIIVITIFVFPLTEEKIKDEPQHVKDTSCDQCSVALKKEGKKNVPVIPTFRRGRMGNVSIDSKSLRSGYGGPAYAAPVVRKMVVENTEPKSFKVSALLKCIGVHEINVYIGSAVDILKEEVILVLTLAIVSYRHLKNSGDFNEIRTHKLCDAGVVLNQLGHAVVNLLGS